MTENISPDGSISSGRNMNISSRSWFSGRLVLLRHTSVGAIIGILILHPITMAVYLFEFSEIRVSVWQLIDIIFSRMFQSFDPIMIAMVGIFALIGGSLGLGSGLYYRALQRKDSRLNMQGRALQQTLLSHIEAGESSKLEFKSSMRWDWVQQKLNKSLEKAVIKTIAGFMNGTGGILLLGVDDEGHILGVEPDYSTLKRSDRDGYQQHLMNLISTHVSASLCELIDVHFHLIEDKDVCVLTILQSREPVYVRQGDVIKYFLRTGNTTRELNTQDAVNHIMRRHDSNRSTG